MRELKSLDHGMLLRAKSVMDDAMATLHNIKELIPEKLHAEFEHILEIFEDELCDCDVSDEYEEKK